MSIKYIQTKSTALTYGISSSSTTIQLKNLLKLDGSSLLASDIGDLLYGTFAPGTSREEIFSIVGSNVTIESDGKVTITSVVRGLKEVSPYNTGGYSCDHPAGEVVVFGNNPQVYQWLKDYIDSIVIAGGVDASSIAKGVVKLSVDPVSPTDPKAVGDNDPRIPTTDYTAAMAGTQGLPNANNKYVTQDNVYTSETDQTQATQNGTVEFGEANSTTKKNIICQSFTPLKTKIKGVRLYKLANTGTFTGDVTVALFADSAGSPTGSALATVTITNAVYNALAVGEFSAEFSAEYSMTAGTLYWFKVSASTADSSNHPNLGTNTAGGYSNGSVKYYNGTDGYVAIATIDLYFKTLQGVNNQIPLYGIPPIIRNYTGLATAYGDYSSRFDITNPSGTTFRYTYDGTGTNPTITSITFPVGAIVNIDSNQINTNNKGSFVITGSGANYFEVNNSAGVAENDKTLATSGYGSLKVNTIQTWTKPTGLKYIKVKVQGAGMGGNGYKSSATTYSGAGGNAGGYCEKVIYEYNLPASVNFSVGKGGGNINGEQRYGLKGGASNFLTLFANGGGRGAEAGSSFKAQTGGGGATGGDLNIDGEFGNFGQYATDDNPGYGGRGIIGGNGGLGAYGSGQSIVGSDGLVIIEEYYS